MSFTADTHFVDRKSMKGQFMSTTSAQRRLTLHFSNFINEMMTMPLRCPSESKLFLRREKGTTNCSSQLQFNIFEIDLKKLNEFAEQFFLLYNFIGVYPSYSGCGSLIKVVRPFVS